MSGPIANARMYAVTPAAEAAWVELFGRVAREAGVPLAYTRYPAPAPLETLWARDALGLAFMCGWPFANLYPDHEPIAAPIPSADWAAVRPFYRTDLIVRRDSAFARLADTRGTRLGWTVEHSQSGYHALRRHPVLDDSWVWTGPLVMGRRVIEALLADEIDVGPLDSYWHLLLARYEPDTAARVRVLESTKATPMPLLVASPGFDEGAVARLRSALTGLPPSDPSLKALGLTGFAAVTRRDYSSLAEAG